MPNPNWMANIPNNNLLLRQIMMPASHDAGVSLVHNAPKGLGGLASAGRYICQQFDIAGQLTAGARFFDVRFEMRAGVPTTVHAFAGAGGWGENAASIFQALDAHLAANNQEFVIMRVSHTDAAAGAAVFAAQQLHLNAARTYTTPTMRGLANTRIRDLRGRAIIAYDSGAIANPNPANGQMKFAKAEKATSRAGLLTCGEYPNSDDMALINYKSVKRTLEHKNRACNAHGHGDHLFMLYWQMTGGNVQQNTTQGGLPPNVMVSALNTNNGTHYNLMFLLTWLRGIVGGTVNHGGSVQNYPFGTDNQRVNWMPNIINLDFINDTVCDRIIAFNQFNLTQAGLWINVP
ncbi:hypothetical protein [Archangium sp.]|jgi:hypothetical protein|uniref:hypothetical protein n=1 Tax=Archangium sp. TaxID=1872627 RepID=UPI002EDB1372